MIDKSHQVPLQDPGMARVYRIYDVTEAFPDREKTYLVFLISNRNFRGRFGDFQGVRSILLNLYGIIQSLDEENIPHYTLKGAVLSEGRLRDTLTHETLHAFRMVDQKQKGVINPERSKFKDNQQYWEAYIRSPAELDAFFVQSATPIWQKYSYAVKRNLYFLKNAVSVSQNSKPAWETFIQQIGTDDISKLSNPANEWMAYRDARLRVLGNSPTDLINTLRDYWPREVPPDVLKRWYRRATQLYGYAVSKEKGPEMSRRARLTKRLIATQVFRYDDWSVSLQDGFIHVTPPTGEAFTVDVRNPLKDQELVALHRRPDVPEPLKNMAEGMASQWRRLIHTTGQWESMRQRGVEAGIMDVLKVFVTKIYRMGRQEAGDILKVIRLSSRAAKGILTKWKPNLTTSERRFILQQLAELPAISTIMAGLVIPGMIETTIVATVILNWIAQRLGLEVDFLPSGFRQEFQEELASLKSLPSDLLMSILMRFLPPQEEDDEVGDITQVLKS